MKVIKPKLQLFLSCLFILFISTGHTQQVVNRIPVPFPVSFDMSPSVRVFTNAAADTACVFVTTEEEATGYILNKEQKLVQQFSFQKNSIRDKVLGAFFSNGTLVFLAGHNDHVRKYAYHFADHITESEDLILATKKELVMALINADSAFYIINCVKDSSLITLRTVSAFAHMSIDSIYIKTNNDLNFFSSSFYETVTSDRSLNKTPNYGYISSPSPEGDLLAKDCKIYYQNDSIYITLNGFAKDVMLISFSPVQPQPVYRKIATTKLPDCNMSFINSRFNSYLLHNRLYTISACETFLQTEVLDIGTGRQLLMKTSRSDEAIAFANTPIIQSIEDSRNWSNKSRELDTKQLLRKMMDGSAIIEAEENNHDVKLTIGSYKEMKFRNIPIPLGFGLLPVMEVVASTAIYNHREERITRFVSVWDKNTFAHRQGLSEMPVEDKIDRFKQKGNIKPYDNCEALYRMNESDLYLYYDPETKSISIVML